MDVTGDVLDGGALVACQRCAVALGVDEALAWGVASAIILGARFGFAWWKTRRVSEPKAGA